MKSNQLNNHFSAGWLAPLIEYCTDITEVMGSNPDQAWIFFSNPIVDKSQNYTGINNRFKVGDLGSGELKSWEYIMF